MPGSITHAPRRRLSRLAAIGLVLMPATGFAQTAPNVLLDAPSLIIKKPPPAVPDVKTQALPWPRLDPGSVLCRSEADLERLAANRSGDPGGGAADCRIMRAPVGISIVQRKGPGRTLVQVSGGDGASGWTDVWLPEKAPAKNTSFR